MVEIIQYIATLWFIYNWYVFAGKSVWPICSYSSDNNIYIEFYWHQKYQTDTCVMKISQIKKERIYVQKKDRRLLKD